MPTSAIVLAAGLGTRMRPLTERLPKPLIEVAGRTLLDRALDRLTEAGVEQAVVNVSYLGGMIEAHLAGRERPRILFSREETPLETGGGIARALPLLGDAPFFSMNADVITLNGAQPFLERMRLHWRPEMDALLLVHPRERAVGYEGKGDFYLHNGILSRDAEVRPYVFTGVQLLHPRLFADAPKGAFSMNLLYGRLIGEGRLFGLAHDGDWLHVGDLAGLEAARARL
jgi:MurNAc alpha-1-phosphate uridylyltransferase